MNKLLFTLLLLLAAFTASAQEIKGKLGYVIDGDSFYMIQDSGRRLRVRVSGIDSPENDQPFGKEATAYLTALLKDSEIIVKPDGADRQGRMVAIITVAGKDVASEMIANGYSWHYKKYSKDIKLAKLETDAKAQKVGLWKEPSPVAPWTFRDQQSASAKAKQ